MAKIGIDLGTTNSLGATFRNGKVELIPNKFGKYITPSVVGLDKDGAILVGDIAKERLITHPELTVSSFKRDMGTTRMYKLGEKSYTPESLSSFIIASIVEDAKNYLGEEIDEVVISVPAYFHDKKRVATKNAGALANVKVNRLINEPSAAALASYINIEQSTRFLVFDFGGGTLDISVVECFENVVEIISVAGDNNLGGDDFNEIIAKSFLDEHDISKNRISKQAYAILLSHAEKAKIKLSTESEVQMTWSHNNKKYTSTFNTNRIIEDGAEIFSRIKSVMDHALIDGGLKASEVNKVILVGGTSEMPAVQAYIDHLFKKTPKVVGNGQESIAYGLGNIIGIMSRQEEIKDYILSDICPFSLGVATFNEADPRNSYASTIIPRNTALPCSRVKDFFTIRDNQDKVIVEVLQGENPYAKDNIKIAEFTIAVPLNKAGAERFDVRFTYDINGILEVDLTICSTGNQINKVFSNCLDENQLELARQELKNLKKHPKDVAENILITERLKSVYAMTNEHMQAFIMQKIMYWDHLLSTQNERVIRDFKAHLERLLEEIEAADPFFTGKNADNVIDFYDYYNK